MFNINPEFYNLLKTLGTQTEQRVNGVIKSGLLNENLASSALNYSRQAASQIRRIQEQADRLSFLTNVPTKNDYTELKQLIVQLEEKMDELEDFFITALQAMQTAVNPQNGTAAAGNDRAERFMKAINSERVLKALSNMSSVPSSLLVKKNG
ncbi:hypothetical protein [Bacillus massiliglaciei]|uniref:hypothetical protein n=1 Tax=Bacillus massiliglaciei TaxID=1816693 RepID=UPI000DA5F72A|nr:hypothetical protein [Bacillus massiliglaciei]